MKIDNAPQCEACDLGHEVPCTCSSYKAPFAPKTPEPAAPVENPCKRCKGAGPSIVRIEGLCEKCFTYTFIDPIVKEIVNSEQLLLRLHSAKDAHMQRMGMARKVQLGVTPKNTRKCARGCGFEAPYGAMYQLIWHEESCKFVKPNTAKKPSSASPRKPRVARPDEANEEVFI